MMKNAIQLFMGKARRVIYSNFFKKTIQRQHARREGDCARCGACCQLLYRCPFFSKLPDGTTACSIHTKRPIVCRHYPSNEADLKDRDLINPDTPCGYRFRDK